VTRPPGSPKAASPSDGRDVSLKQTLAKPDRIKRRKDLSRVFQQGKSASDGSIRLHVLANSLGRSRMAVTVSAHDGNAVQRNRIKRICREGFRTCRQDLPGGYDYVLQPRAGSQLSLDSVRASLTALAGRLIREASP